MGNPLTGEALIKEVCRRVRVARSYWDAHNNAACRGERDRALALYNTLTKEQKTRFRSSCGCGFATAVKNILGNTERHPSRNERRSRIRRKVRSIPNLEAVQLEQFEGWMNGYCSTRVIPGSFSIQLKFAGCVVSSAFNLV